MSYEITAKFKLIINEAAANEIIKDAKESGLVKPIASDKAAVEAWVTHNVITVKVRKSHDPPSLGGVEDEKSTEVRPDKGS